ncbi:MAG: ABC transporter permease [Bacteriovoracaceae bacterium]|nr:ABC transporter permease [Bacteriovoracaceae bacterium]
MISREHAVTKTVELLGAKVIETLNGLGRFTSYLNSVMFWMFRKPYRWHLFFDQMYFVANKSLFIIGLVSIFTGAVFAYQTYLGFAGLGFDSFIGPVVAISMAKELAPVLGGLVISGRCGAAMAANIGTMKVTEQVDALEVMGINSHQYLAVPRIAATVVSLPILSSIFLLIGNFGSWLIGTKVLAIDEMTYLSKIPEFVEMKDVYEGLIKAMVFGFLISIIATYHGFQVKGGAEGVGRGTNLAVVWGMVIVLVVDFFLTSILTLIL